MSAVQVGLSDAFSELTKAPITDIYNGLKNIVKMNQARFLEDFSKYCNYMYGKTSLVRTLYSKSKPLQLSDVYISTFFTTDTHERVSDIGLQERFSKGARIIIKGNGGSGKTFFMKWLWIERFTKHAARIPILIELRRISDLATVDLAAFCRLELQAESIFGKGVFEQLCAEGRFEFIFDGFDEVAKEKRKVVEKQIIEMSEKYQKCCFLISGREDDRFTGWGPFEIYEVTPLALSDVKVLIEKIPFDLKVKKRFVEGLTEDFYSTHRSFLSNPLLAIMMLMTFSDNAIIPSKLTTFYDHAFQTMLTWHDATKDSFERDRTLTLDEFRKVFSTFCLLSYYQQSFEFDESSLRRYIEKSLRYHSIDADIEGVRNDICESVNLVQRDGLKYVFVHRSFQEFFAAECAMFSISGKAREFLSFFAKRQRDSVLKMAFELHPEMFIDEYLRPNADLLFESDFFQGIDGRKSIVSRLKLSTRGFMSAERNLPRVYMEFNHALDKSSGVEFLENCGRISESDFGISPENFFVRSVYDCIRKSAKDLDLLNNDNFGLSFSISIEPERTKVSIRNRGIERLDSTSMRNLRSYFVSEFSKSVPEIDRSAKSYLRNARAFIQEQINSRKMQSTSIDQILGLDS